MGKALVVRPPKESIKGNLPEIFLNSGYRKCRVIIDCAEVLIERPKSSAQAATWSEYKHHNTFKCLVGITPTGFISSSLLVMEVEQVKNLSPEIVGFMIY